MVYTFVQVSHDSITWEVIEFNNYDAIVVFSNTNGPEHSMQLIKKSHFTGEFCRWRKIRKLSNRDYSPDTVLCSDNIACNDHTVSTMSGRMQVSDYMQGQAYA